MCGCGGTNTPAPVVVYVDLSAVMSRLEALEELVANEVEQLTALNTKFDDFVADVRAELARLEAERGELSPEGQAALDALVAKVDAADAEVGDADGSDTPAPPVEPTPEPAPGEPSA